VDTSAISYRVADFLKKHPPFQAIEEADLLGLAARGRVRFHEANDFLVWQGEPHKPHVFVIQQGTVTLWDEANGRATLRDVRGAGDMLGIERFTDAPRSLFSARSESDVLIYAFPSTDFEARVMKYPYARQFVEAYDTVTADYQGARNAREPQRVFVHDVIRRRPLASCNPQTPIRDAAHSLLTTGADALAVVDANSRVETLITVNSLLAWIAGGGGDAGHPVSELDRGAPPTIGSAASVTDAVLAIGETGADGLALTSDGSPGGELQSVVTPRDIARVFGDEPTAILHEIRRATHTRELGELNHRARALMLQHLSSAASLDWLARFAFLTDVQVVKRLIALAGGAPAPACWCFCGAAGREESLTRHAPQLVLVAEDERTLPQLLQTYEHVSGGLAECDYLSRVDASFDRAVPGSARVASTAEWQARYHNWLRDPVRAEMHLARPLFDLRAVHGPEALWRDVETTVAGAIDRDLVQVLANDCLASLPPLTFFEDAVVDESGEHTAVFRLEHSALQPLVDVGRVFGMAARTVLGTSTRQRLAGARTLLPEHESVFREASETLRILLWQQGRIGIDQGTNGSDLPPALLSRHDRHVLKSGFRSILRLLELTGNSPWYAGL
jgi:CBS domain-containing protein